MNRSPPKPIAADIYDKMSWRGDFIEDFAEVSVRNWPDHERKSVQLDFTELRWDETSVWRDAYVTLKIAVLNLWVKIYRNEMGWVELHWVGLG